MAQYDGSIRIKTDIETKQSEVQLATLENQIVKTADKIESLRSKMDALKDTEIPTQEYQEISSQIEKAEQKFNKLLEKQEQMQREGKDNGVAWQKLNDQMDEVGNEINYAKGELQDLVDTGKAFTLGSDTEKFAQMEQQLGYLENDMDVLLQKEELQKIKLEEAKEKYKKLGDTGKKSLDKISKSQKKATGLLVSFGTRLKSIISAVFIFNLIRKALNSMILGVKEGFKNLYNDSEKFKNSVDNLKASLTTFKNSLAAAFAPIIELAIPYIEKLIDYMTHLMDMVGQFVAAIKGQKTYTKAIKQTTGAIEDETKASNKQLSSLDKLNNLSSEQKSGDTDSDTGTMFEEVPIDSGILDFFQKMKDFLQPIIDYAKKLKDIFMQGFWDGLGDWEYRWQSIKDSIASIKESLIDIFTDPAVVAAADAWAQSVAYMLGSLVGSVASIGLTIATNFIGGIAKYLEQNKDRIKNYLINMFNIWEEVNYLFADLFQSIAYVFEAFASEDGQQLTANIIGIFVDTFMGIMELASKFFRDIASIIIKPFVDNKEGFRTALEGFFGVLSEVTGTIKQGIDDTFDHLNQVYDEHFKPFFDSVAQGMSELIGKFLEFWNSNVQPMLEEWGEKFDVLWKEHLQPMFDSLSDVLGSVADLFKALWENYLMPFFNWLIESAFPVLLPLIDGTYDTIMVVIGGISDLIDDLLGVIKGLIDTVVNLIEGDWTGAWESAESVVSNIWESIKSIIKLGVEFIQTQINSMLSAFENIDFDFLFGKAGKTSASFVKGKNTSAYSVSAMSMDWPEIPGYATGQVIPRAMKQHLAILGDNNRETEVVSPLSTMKQAFMEAMAKAGMAGNNSNGGGNNVYEFSVDGQVFFRIMEKYAAEYKKQHGGKAAFS